MGTGQLPLQPPQPQPTVGIKPAASSYLVIPTLLIILLVIVTTSAHPALAALISFVVVAGLLATVWTLWVHFHDVSLGRDAVRYRTAFAEQRIRFADLTRVTVSIGYQQESRAQQGFYRLNLYDRGRYAMNPLTINMKPFGKNDLAYLLTALARRAPAATLDAHAQEIAAGNLSGVIATGVQQVIVYTIPILFASMLACLLVVQLLATH